MENKEKPTSFDTVVLSGGGPDGIAFIGALEELGARGALRGLRTIVGCSAGAIVALFVALGMTAAEMRAWVSKGVEDGSLTEVDVDGMLCVTLAQDQGGGARLGLDDGERVVAALRAAVRACPRLRSAFEEEDGGDGDRRDDVTFLELAKATGRDLVLCATNLEEGRQELFGVDTSPDMGIVKAVRMSISVPLLFTPVRHGGRTYVDGGVVDYCPVERIKASGAATRTLVLRIVPPARTLPTDRSVECPPPSGIVEFAWLLSRAVLMRTSSGPILQSAQHANTAVVEGTATSLTTVDVPSLMLDDPPVCSFSLLSMTLRLEESGVDAYIRHGRDVARAFFSV